MRFLVGRLTTLPVVVLATMRDSVVDRTDALVHTLAALARERTTTRLRLDGTRNREVGELLADRGLHDAALSLELWNRRAPFFLVELLELMRSERRLSSGTRRDRGPRLGPRRAGAAGGSGRRRSARHRC